MTQGSACLKEEFLNRSETLRKSILTSSGVPTHAHHLSRLQRGRVLPQRHQQRSALNQLHHNHYRLLLHTDSDQFDDVRVIVLLEDSTLLQELPLLLVRQRHPARLHRHILLGGSQLRLVDIAKVALKRVKIIDQELRAIERRDLLCQFCPTE